MQLEAADPGGWLAKATDCAVGEGTPAIVDSARTRAQVQRLRERRPAGTVIHIEAETTERQRRYEQTTPGAHALTFSELARTRAEIEVLDLVQLADLRVDTTTTPVDDVAVSVIRWLRERFSVIEAERGDSC
jgi:RNase adaptor protein for sRNA GlmZ degradation